MDGPQGHRRDGKDFGDVGRDVSASRVRVPGGIGLFIAGALDVPSPGCLSSRAHPRFITLHASGIVVGLYGAFGSGVHS